MATPRPPLALERWYVLIVMCLVYAINIAARYVVSTVFEPIRLELALTDAGAAFLTGRSAGIVLCGVRNSHLVARRPLQPAQHSGGLADRLVRLHGPLRPVAFLLAASLRPHRCGHSAKRAGRRRRHPSSRTTSPPSGGPWP